MTSQIEWLDSARGPRSRRSIFLAIGIDPSNMDKKAKTNSLTAEQIIDIAYELDISPVQALYDTEFLREIPEIERMSREELTEQIEKLIAQLRKELAEEEQESPATVHQLHPRVRGEPDNWMPEDAVADDSPEEGDGMPDDYLP